MASNGDRQRVLELEREVAELRRVSQLKDEFLDNVSHELRLQIATVRNVLSNAVAGVFGQPTEKMGSSFRMAEAHIDKLTHVLGDLLQIARLEAGRVTLDRRLVSPREAIDDAVAAFADAAHAKGIAIGACWDGVERSVFWDRERIYEILSNLMDNAVTFTPQGGEVRIAGRIVADEGGDGMVCIEVSDTGPGVPPTLRDGIFDRFRTTGKEGMGLGLSIGRQLAELHGGTLQLAAESPGAHFIVNIPLLRGDRLLTAAADDQMRLAAMRGVPLALLLLVVENGDAPVAPQLASDVGEGIARTLRRKSDVVLSLAPARAAIFLPETTQTQGEAVIARLAAALAPAVQKYAGARLAAGIASVSDRIRSAAELVQSAEQSLRAARAKGF